MYGDELRTGPGDLRTCVLRSPDGQAECQVIPERGGLVSRFRVGGDEVLFLDESTVVDRTKNVRGGIPVLFPNAGRLPGDRYRLDGQELVSPQHGFARRLPWEIAEHGSDGNHAWIEMRLISSEETLTAFPCPFVLTMRVVLEGTTLLLDTKLENTGHGPMPHALGFHPYFHVLDSEKARAGVRTDAKVALDNTTGKDVAVKRLDFTVPELDLHLKGHSTPGTLVRRGSLPTLALGWSTSFTTLVLWTLAGRDFICVEPWEAPAGALASEGHAPVLLPGQSLDMAFTIAAGAR